MTSFKAAREQANLKQSEAARRLKVTPSYLSMVEAGQRFPRPTILRRFAKVYKVTMDFFYQEVHETQTEEVN
jgi:transcriptional regulator with XRE-family HTH domain